MQQQEREALVMMTARASSIKVSSVYSRGQHNDRTDYNRLARNISGCDVTLETTLLVKKS
ncbi:hypothetical protein E2C01_074270 [Portunus trituberculatus]|uniref:Uncharacterized protein n=1 Tax=Portunus trituberculatus TaxID=210409 RepID=A0A5B7ICS9_PORTR|nr:hypothetical protein [Portunus trituberculatus]